MTWDITPEPQLYYLAQSRRSWSWHEALAEVIANSHDAGATDIIIRGSPRELTVVDNGKGCSDPVVMLRPGARKEYDSTESGKYGVGGKQVMYWLWGQTIITTCDGNSIVHVTIDWERQRDWGVGEQHIKRDSAANWPRYGLIAPTGTSIQYRPHKRRNVSTIAEKRERDLLAWHFKPAIEEGLKITICYVDKTWVLPNEPFPKLEEEVYFEAEVGGKQFTVRAGVIAQGESLSRAGFWFVRGPDVLEKTFDPANGFQATRVFGWVTLNRHDWMPSTNKNGLDDDDRAELCSAIGELCRDVLRKAQEWHEEVYNDSIETELSHVLSAVMGPYLAGVPFRKAKRASPPVKDVGTVTPKGTAITHKRAARTQPGSKTLHTSEPPPGHGVMFRFGRLDPEQFFKVDQQLRHVIVTFNNELSLVKMLSKEKGQFGLAAMAQAAVGAYNAGVETNGQRRLIEVTNVHDWLNQMWCRWNVHAQDLDDEEDAVGVGSA